MKKILSFLMIAICSFSISHAQVAMTATNGLTMDTSSNANGLSKTLTTKVKSNGTVSVVLAITKISGTVGGTATIQGSNNGTDFYGLASAYTITDATQTTGWDFDRTKYLYYRVAIVGTGTMSASVKASILGK